MRWALPIKVTEKNIDYAKHCLDVAKRSIVCDRTMRTKPIGHEQYCKHFVKKEHEDTCYQKDIENLERMINEYESQNACIDEILGGGE
jgi:hypothetical protein